MKARILKIDEGVVVTLPEETLQLLGLADGAEVSVALDPERRQVVISAGDTDLAGIDETFARQVAEFIEEYRPALEALAR